MPSTPSSQRPTPLHLADLRGLARLGLDGVLGVTDVVEGMHKAITAVPLPLGKPVAGRTRGITGLVYRSVRGITRGVGWGLDTALGALPMPRESSTPEREALLAALNGVWGDHLAASGNPLAIPMTLRINGLPWQAALRAAATAPSSRLLVQVHGLAMNDLQWQRNGHDHGAVLAQQRGFTAVHLHYNTGLSIGHNAQNFALLLDQLVAQWPVPVERIVLLGHSMGGLVARGACWWGTHSRWLPLLTDLICLGSPHHGAPLERGGRLIDAALGLSPYAAPLARLGASRSAGIHDLRDGRIRSETKSPAQHAQRLPTPLPEGVRTFVVAAVLTESLPRKTAIGAAQTLAGDGLVPLASALGEHADPDFDLGVPPQRRMVIRQANHWDLLDNPAVGKRLLKWVL